MAIEIIFKNKIADKLEQVKNEKGLTKVDIAKFLGVTKQNIDSLCESRFPSITTLLKLSFVLNCNISELFDYKIVEK